ncbi:MAG: DUF87 domain-containing protein [Bacteroides sp.]|nr:DUF87 domain-containing protein [Bacteroides sp.]MCM1550337.1 DUF87 domain-containing protein [Clostridium sp.]
MKNYEPEQYSLSEYASKIKSSDMMSLYFDKKHIVNVRDYPHFLISGQSGSGKSYLANQIVIQTIMKGWEVIILDLKRSYGLYKNFTDYQNKGTGRALIEYVCGEVHRRELQKLFL